MDTRIRKYFTGVVLLLLILVPRIGLLFNGLDSQRIWDTNTPAAFRFLEALHSGHLQEFFREGQKYPLLGSYAFVPMVGVYYFVGYLADWYASPQDFMNAFVLGKTNLFFLIRLQMLFINLFSLWLLYRLTVRFTNHSSRAGLYVILFSVVNFYITIFSVMPRIHSFAFLGITLTLYTSLRLLENTTWSRSLMAFGAAAFSASVAQSGFTALILPLVAHCYDYQEGRWKLRIDKKIVSGAFLFSLSTMILGYPRTLLWMFDPSLNFFSTVLLGSSHGVPRLSLTPLPFLYLFSSEYISLWLAGSAAWYRWCASRGAMLMVAPQDYLAFAHVIAFFGIFGFSSVFSGRFMLVVMPTLFFLLARFFIQLEQRRWVAYILIVIVAFHAYGIVQLSRIAWTGDTRAAAAAYLLATTDARTQLLTTLDPVLLGIIPTPEAIRKGQIPLLGVNAILINQHNLTGPQSRNITLWRPTENILSDEQVRSFDYAIVSWSDSEAPQVEKRLLRNNFHLVKTFFASHDGERHPSFVPWDFITPIPREPLVLALSRYRAFGPTLSLYKRL